MSITKIATLIAIVILAVRTANGQEIGFIKGADISWLQEIEAAGGVFRENGVAVDIIAILKNHGVNTIRLRLWHTPVDGINGIDSTLRMAERAKEAGLNVMLDIHFSDWWADPGKQTKPAAWNGISFEVLKDSLRNYVHDVIIAMKNRSVLPRVVQFGNEIIGGMLWPEGDIRGDTNTVQQWSRFTDLLKTAHQGMTDALSSTDTVLAMIHIDRGADYNACAWFFDNLFTHAVPCDLIGLSYYPWWHGSFDNMVSTVNKVAQRYNKGVVIAELAYPYTLQNFDSQNNFVWNTSQLLPAYPATIEGQKQFIADVIETMKQIPGNKGKGIVYWEPDGIALPKWLSPWDNLALFGSAGDVLASIGAFETSPLPVSRREEKKSFEIFIESYPNPFNPATTIQFQIPLDPPLQSGTSAEGGRRIPVTLKVYDATGKEVATLVNDHKAPGIYRVVWNAAGYASGTYYYTLTAGGSSITKKMLLMK